MAPGAAGPSGRAARSRARVKTSSSIAGVSLPVNVFCWLGWKQPTSVNGPTAPRRRGRTAASAAARVPERGERPQRAVPRERPERDDHAHVPSAAISRSRNGRHVSRSSRRRLVRRRRAAVHRRDVGVREPQTVVARDRRRLVREPAAVERREQEVARPVAREDPAGAVAAVGGRAPARRSSRRAAGSPNPGTGRPQYSWSAKRATLVRAASSRHATNRGHARQATTSASIRSSPVSRSSSQERERGGPTGRGPPARRRRGRGDRWPSR